MAKKVNNTGNCELCKQNVDHREVKKHIEKCIKSETSNDFSNANQNEEIFLIKVSAHKIFWLYIEINGSSALAKLDDFLRETWLECCGHLSQFRINGKDYSNDSSMKKTIHQALSPSDKFDYEYDFGDTTELEGQVISIRPGKLKKEIRLIARNNLPEMVQCTTCKKIPEIICTCCYDFCCKKCKKNHTKCDGEDYMLPVVNSPRMGVCGYTGNE